MARIELSDGTIVDLNAAAATWQQCDDVRASLFDDLPRPAADVVEKLYKTKAGSYILVSWNKGGEAAVQTARRLNRVHACRWLLLNGRDVPDDLKPLADALLE